MNFRSLLQSLIPSHSASNPSKPARPPLAGAMLEKLEDRVLLSAVSLSTDKSAAKAYREMIMGAAGGEIYMPLSSASSATPAVGIIAWSQAEPKPIIIEGRTARGGFGIFRDGDLRQPLTVNYQITGGTADGGDHTLSQSGSVTIKRGRKGVRLPVQAADDALVEGNETLVVGLTPGEGYSLGSSSSSTLTVGDDDAVPDLSLQGLSEEQEETPGAMLAVGAERIPLALNLEGSVRFGSKAILSIASGADQIRVWSAQSGGQLLLDADRPGKKWKGENLPSTLWIEAAAPSQSSGDIALTLSFYPNRSATQPATDTVKVTAFQADLAIDSNNDGSITEADDLIEDDADKPGRLILANNDDDDANGIADYLDSGTVQGEDDLVGMDLNILGLISGTATLSIESGADKVLVWLNPQKDGLGPILGGLVMQKTWDLGQQPGTVYVEAIAGSLVAGDISFALAAGPSSAPPATDTAKATAEPIPVVSIAWVSDGSEDPDPAYPNDGPKPLQFQISRSANALDPEDPYADDLKVYLDQPDGMAEAGTDYESLPEYILIPAGQSSAVLSVKPVDDDQIEPHETMIVTLAQDPMDIYGFADPATLPAAEGEIKDNDVLIILIAGKGQSGGENDPEGVDNGAGINTLKAKLIDAGFKEGEIKLTSSDSGGVANGTDLSKERVKQMIETAAIAAGDRQVEIALAGYSWGGGLIYDALAELNDKDANGNPIEANGVMPGNVSVKVTVYIDAIDLGSWSAVWPPKPLEPVDAETGKPASTQVHYNYFQSIDDQGIDNAPNGRATVGNNHNVDLDDSDSHNLWGGVPQPAEDNTFNHLTIDDHQPLRSDIVDKLKAAFARGAM